MSSGSFTYEIPVECWREKDGHIKYEDVDHNTVRMSSRLGSKIIGHFYKSGELEVSNEIMLHLTVNWYYDPGCMHMSNGDPGYPPEGGEERMVDKVTIEDHKLPEEIAREFEELFEYIIGEYEFPKECYES